MPHHDNLFQIKTFPEIVFLLSTRLRSVIAIISPKIISMYYHTIILRTNLLIAEKILNDIAILFKEL